MAYGFTAHPYYLGIYSNMQTASIKRMGRVTDVVRLQAAPPVAWAGSHFLVQSDIQDRVRSLQSR